MVSDKKIFSFFPQISLCQTCDPQGQGKIWPEGDNLNKLGRVPLGDAKALGLMVSDKIHIFPIYAYMYVKHVTS